jgi:hypothetical protein
VHKSPLQPERGICTLVLARRPDRSLTDGWSFGSWPRSDGLVASGMACFCLVGCRLNRLNFYVNDVAVQVIFRLSKDSCKQAILDLSATISRRLRLRFKNNRGNVEELLKCRKLLRHLLGFEPSVEPDFSGRTRNRPTGPFVFPLLDTFSLSLYGE